MTVLVKTAWRLTYNDGKCRETVNVIADTLEQAQAIAVSFFTCVYSKDAADQLRYVSASTYEIMEQAA